MKKTIVTLGLALCALTVQAYEHAEVIPTSVSAKMATPLGNAIIKGEIEVVRKFVEYGADVNEMSNGMTPLMLAARYNRAEIISFLLENGANPKIKTETGWTALKYAELSKATDAIALLARK